MQPAQPSWSLIYADEVTALDDLELGKRGRDVLASWVTGISLISDSSIQWQYETGTTEIKRSWPIPAGSLATVPRVWTSEGAFDAYKLWFNQESRSPLGSLTLSLDRETLKRDHFNQQHSSWLVSRRRADPFHGFSTSDVRLSTGGGHYWFRGRRINAADAGLVSSSASDNTKEVDERFKTFARRFSDPRTLYAYGIYTDEKGVRRLARLTNSKDPIYARWSDGWSWVATLKAAGDNVYDIESTWDKSALPVTLTINGSTPSFGIVAIGAAVDTQQPLSQYSPYHPFRQELFFLSQDLQAADHQLPLTNTSVRGESVVALFQLRNHLYYLSRHQVSRFQSIYHYDHDKKDTLVLELGACGDVISTPQSLVWSDARTSQLHSATLIGSVDPTKSSDPTRFSVQALGIFGSIIDSVSCGDLAYFIVLEQDSISYQVKTTLLDPDTFLATPSTASFQAQRRTLYVTDGTLKGTKQITTPDASASYLPLYLAANDNGLYVVTTKRDTSNRTTDASPLSTGSSSRYGLELHQSVPGVNDFKESSESFDTSPSYDLNGVHLGGDLNHIWLLPPQDPKVFVEEVPANVEWKQSSIDPDHYVSSTSTVTAASLKLTFSDLGVDPTSHTATQSNWVSYFNDDKPIPRPHTEVHAKVVEEGDHAIMPALHGQKKYNDVSWRVSNSAFYQPSEPKPPAYYLEIPQVIPDIRLSREIEHHFYNYKFSHSSALYNASSKILAFYELLTFQPEELFKTTLNALSKFKRFNIPHFLGALIKDSQDLSNLLTTTTDWTLSLLKHRDNPEVLRRRATIASTAAKSALKSIKEFQELEAFYESLFSSNQLNIDLYKFSEFSTFKNFLPLLHTASVSAHLKLPQTPAELIFAEPEDFTFARAFRSSKPPVLVATQLNEILSAQEKNSKIRKNNVDYTPSIRLPSEQVVEDDKIYFKVPVLETASNVSEQGTSSTSEILLNLLWGNFNFAYEGMEYALINAGGQHLPLQIIDRSRDFEARGLLVFAEQRAEAFSEILFSFITAGLGQVPRLARLLSTTTAASGLTRFTTAVKGIDILGNLLEKSARLIPFSTAFQLVLKEIEVFSSVYSIQDRDEFIESFDQFSAKIINSLRRHSAPLFKESSLGLAQAQSTSISAPTSTSLSQLDDQQQIAFNNDEINSPAALEPPNSLYGAEDLYTQLTNFIAEMAVGLAEGNLSDDLLNEIRLNTTASNLQLLTNTLAAHPVSSEDSLTLFGTSDFKSHIENVLQISLPEPAEDLSTRSLIASLLKSEPTVSSEPQGSSLDYFLGPTGSYVSQQGDQVVNLNRSQDFSLFHQIPYESQPPLALVLSLNVDRPELTDGLSSFSLLLNHRFNVEFQDILASNEVFGFFENNPEVDELIHGISSLRADISGKFLPKIALDFDSYHRTFLGVSSPVLEDSPFWLEHSPEFWADYNANRLPVNSFNHGDLVIVSHLVERRPQLVSANGGIHYRRQFELRIDTSTFHPLALLLSKSYQNIPLNWDSSLPLIDPSFVRFPESQSEASFYNGIQTVQLDFSTKPGSTHRNQSNTSTKPGFLSTSTSVIPGSHYRRGFKPSTFQKEWRNTYDASPPEGYGTLRYEFNPSSAQISFRCDQPPKDLATGVVYLKVLVRLRSDTDILDTLYTHNFHPGQTDASITISDAIASFLSRLSSDAPLPSQITVEHEATLVDGLGNYLIYEGEDDPGNLDELLLARISNPITGHGTSTIQLRDHQITFTSEIYRFITGSQSFEMALSTPSDQEIIQLTQGECVSIRVSLPRSSLYSLQRVYWRLEGPNLDDPLPSLQSYRDGMWGYGGWSDLLLSTPAVTHGVYTPPLIDTGLYPNSFTQAYYLTPHTSDQDSSFTLALYSDSDYAQLVGRSPSVVVSPAQPQSTDLVLRDLTSNLPISSIPENLAAGLPYGSLSGGFTRIQSYSLAPVSGDNDNHRFAVSNGVLYSTIPLDREGLQRVTAQSGNTTTVESSVNLDFDVLAADGQQLRRVRQKFYIADGNDKPIGTATLRSSYLAPGGYVYINAYNVTDPDGWNKQLDHVVWQRSQRFYPNNFTDIPDAPDDGRYLISLDDGHCYLRAIVTYTDLSGYSNSFTTQITPIVYGKPEYYDAAAYSLQYSQSSSSDNSDPGLTTKSLLSELRNQSQATIEALSPAAINFSASTKDDYHHFPWQFFPFAALTPALSTEINWSWVDLTRASLAPTFHPSLVEWEQLYLVPERQRADIYSSLNWSLYAIDSELASRLDWTLLSRKALNLSKVLDHSSINFAAIDYTSKLFPWSSVNYAQLSPQAIASIDWSLIDYGKARLSPTFDYNLIDWSELHRAPSAKSSVYRTINWRTIQLNAQSASYLDLSLVNLSLFDPRRINHLVSLRFDTLGALAPRFNWSLLDFQSLNLSSLNSIDWRLVDYVKAQRSSSFRLEHVDWSELHTSARAAATTYAKINWKNYTITPDVAERLNYLYLDPLKLDPTRFSDLNTLQFDQLGVKTSRLDWAKVNYGILTAESLSSIDWSRVPLAKASLAPSFQLAHVDWDEVSASKTALAAATTWFKSAAATNLLASAAADALTGLNPTALLGAHKLVTFTAAGTTYGLVTTAVDAYRARAASGLVGGGGGHLAELETEAEASALSQALFDPLTGLLRPSTPLWRQLSGSVAKDGGHSRYLWLGGSDADQEGEWKWLRGGEISLDRVEWGEGQGLQEPDNFGPGAGQDALALALQRWPLAAKVGAQIGDAGEWNDLSSSNRLGFLVEF